MRFEDPYFRRKAPDPEKLEAFGFRKEEDGAYSYTKLLMEGTFRAEIRVSPGGRVFGKLIDLEFGDEFYQIHSDSQRGAFVAEIGEEYGALLEEIAEHCFLPRLFVHPQSNRIADRVRETFGEVPDHPFEKDPAGVFRNPENRKWYGIILQVDRSKLRKPGDPVRKQKDPGEDPVEILNVKLDPEKIRQLVDRDGFYECYHMNKKYWITVLLEDIVPDEAVMELLGESRNFTLKKGAGRRNPGTGAESPRKWLMPANVYQYDVPAALAGDPVLLWKHGSRVRPGDLVYLYFSAPVSAIRYQFRVLESDIPYHFSDERMNERGETAMRMELQREYIPPFPVSEMRKYGVGPVRGPRFMPEELEERINDAL